MTNCFLRPQIEVEIVLGMDLVIQGIRGRRKSTDI